MKFNFKKRFCAAFLATMVTVTTGSFSAFGAQDNIEFVFTDVTQSDTTTLKGEAKIKVSVKGAGGNLSIAQTSLNFSGELKYKSIEFLKGENNPAAGNAYVTPNSALANSINKLDTSIICARTPLVFTDNLMDLFILTFTGESGDSVSVSLNTDSTYCTVDGKDIVPTEKEVSVTAAASSKANSGKKAEIRLTMDKVTDFAAGGNEEYASSDVELKITSESKSGYMIFTVLNNTLVSKGGHRENSTIPAFTVNNTVLADDTYTVEISGIGYVPYKKSGVSFDDSIQLTNADFIPGDVNGDEKVTSVDKEICEKLISNGEYSTAADFNRDDAVNRYDLKIFDGISDGMGENGDTDTGDKTDNKNEKKAPEKITGLTADGGKDCVTLKWTKPDDTITGYKLKYGTDRDNLDKTENITETSSAEYTVDDLNANTTYYFQLAAVNANGTGEFSDIVNEKTAKAESGSGGGSGGSGGGSGVSLGGGNTAAVTTTTIGGFTDISNYRWAQDAIISLKSKGIISGVSETEFAPQNNIKRGDFILILMRMLKIENEVDGNFADVAEGSYYYDAIAKAKAAGIATGDGENFMPESTITRQDLITLAYRAFANLGYIEKKEDTSVLDSFIDKELIDEYAVGAMASMVNAGIIQGADGLVNPKGNATRAEVAVMCERLLGLEK